MSAASFDTPLPSRPVPRVLLVDPSDPVRTALRRMIQSHPFEILEARTPAECLKLLSGGARIDVLVAALALPGLTGPDLADQIAQGGRRLPALFYSSLAAPRGRPLEAEEAFLQMPLGVKALVATLRNLADRGAAGTPKRSPAPPAPRARAAKPNHVLKIYEDDGDLAETVAPFLVDGLRSGEHVIVIATTEHWTAFAHAMKEDGLDPGLAVDRGDLVVIDATEALKGLLSGSTLDVTGFEVFFASLMNSGGAEPGFVRVYGEIVDLLWRRGMLDLALTLEGLWNEHIEPGRFRVLCGYPRSLMEDPQRRAFLRVTETHSHVVLA